MKRSAVRRILHFLLAFLLFIIGIIGLILPLINGTLFIVLALIVLSIENKKVEDFLYNLASKNEKVSKIYSKLDAFIKKILRA